MVKEDLRGCLARLHAQSVTLAAQARSAQFMREQVDGGAASAEEASYELRMQQWQALVPPEWLALERHLLERVWQRNAALAQLTNDVEEARATLHAEREAHVAFAREAAAARNALQTSLRDKQAELERATAALEFMRRAREQEARGPPPKRTCNAEAQTQPMVRSAAVQTKETFEAMERRVRIRVEEELKAEWQVRMESQGRTDRDWAKWEQLLRTRPGMQLVRTAHAHAPGLSPLTPPPPPAATHWRVG